MFKIIPELPKPVKGHSLTKGVTPATLREELAFLFFGVWQMAGLVLDGWAHRYKPELESIFTPWHAVFYGGFTATVSWFAFMLIRRRSQATSLRGATPRGYELSAVGLVIFAIGGVGDSIWHSYFGIESGLDALVSPTHILLLLGVVLINSGPVRSAFARPDADSSFVSFLPVSLSVTLAISIISFFFLYANGFNNANLSQPFVQTGSFNNPAILGVLRTLVSTVILFSPTIYLIRRWRVPTGSFVLIYGLVGLVLVGLDAFEFWWQIAAPLYGGLVADIVVRFVSDKYVEWVAAVAIPIGMWSVSTLMIHMFWSVVWPPDLWVGQINLAVICALGLVTLTSSSRPNTATLRQDSSSTPHTIHT